MIGGWSAAFGENIGERRQWGAATVGWETRMVPDAPEGKGSCKQKSETAALSSLLPLFSPLFFLLTLQFLPVSTINIFISNLLTKHKTSWGRVVININ